MARQPRKSAGLLAAAILVLAGCQSAAPAGQQVTATGVASVSPAGAASLVSASSPAAAPSAVPSASGQGETLDGLVSGARQEGQLTLSWGAGLVGDSAGVARLIDGFKAAYGLDINVQYTPGPNTNEMIARDVQEEQAGQPSDTDVLEFADSTMAPLVTQNAMLPDDWQSWAPSIQNPEMQAPNGIGVSFVTDMTGTIYNSDLLTGDQVPQTLADLLKPEFKGRIAATSYAANFDLLADPKVWGKEKMLDFTRQLATQVSGLVRCSDADRVASGEFLAIAFICDQGSAAQVKAAGGPVDFTVARDAPVLHYTYMGVPKNAAHPDAAKLFINYMLSQQGQQILYQNTYLDNDLVPGSHTNQIRAQYEAQGVQFIVFDSSYWTQTNVSDHQQAIQEASSILAGTASS